MQSDRSKAWDHARSEYNHDWLKNRFLNRLDDAVLRLRLSDVKDPEFLAILNDDMIEWNSNRGTLDWILASAESHLSPATLFGSGPLLYCDATVKSWLPGAIHELWLVRCGIRQKAEAVRRISASCDAAASEAIRSLAAGAAPLRPLHQIIDDFAKHCRQLSDAISALPHEVCVV